MTLPPLRRLGFPIWRSRCRAGATRACARCSMLMLPVTIGLGLINFNLLSNSMLGSLVSDEAPAAIDKAFRDLHAPAGDVLRRRRDRAVPRSSAGSPPAATSTGCGARAPNGDAPDRAAADPGRRRHDRARARRSRGCVYERGEFDAESTDQIAEALFWFAISLPFAGANLILTRTFFSLQQPWTPTALARRLRWPSTSPSRSRCTADRDRGRGARHRRLQRRA